MRSPLSSAAREGERRRQLLLSSHVEGLRNEFMAQVKAAPPEEKHSSLSGHGEDGNEDGGEGGGPTDSAPSAAAVAYREFRDASNAAAAEGAAETGALAASFVPPTSPMVGGRRAQQRSAQKSNEFLIHDDPLATLDPAVLQLLGEKNIALRLFPASRHDARMAVRSRFATSTDKFKDAHVIGHGLLCSRVINQGLDSMAVPHPSDEIDAITPTSLVQTSRRGTEFPVPPWDGTTRNIAAKDIGLWRDPGWDLHPPKGDTKLQFRNTTTSLIDS